MESLKTRNFNSWIESIQHLLKPPVGNKLMYGSGQLKIMIVGGPNKREDFHIESGEELFYMIKGDMQLDIMQGGVKREIPIKEGEMFLLPARIPHSPQRFPDTIGLVIERERAADEYDGLRWYIPGTDDILYEEWFHCEDLGTQLKPIIERFFASKEYETKIPSKVIPDPPLAIDNEAIPSSPEKLINLLKNNHNSKEKNVLYDSEFRVTALTSEYNSSLSPPSTGNDGEIFFWQYTGTRKLNIQFNSDQKLITLETGDVFLLPKGFSYFVLKADESDFDVNRKEDLTLLITNKKCLKS